MVPRKYYGWLSLWPETDEKSADLVGRCLGRAAGLYPVPGRAGRVFLTERDDDFGVGNVNLEGKQGVHGTSNPRHPTALVVETQIRGGGRKYKSEKKTRFSSFCPEKKTILTLVRSSF